MVRQNIILAVNTAQLHAREESKEDLLNFFHRSISADVVSYFGHVLRKTHDLHNATRVYDQLGSAEEIVVRYDFKMKLLSLRYRESTTDFYGKRGTVLAGCAVTMKKQQEPATTPTSSTTPHQPTKYRSDLVTTFYDVTTDSSKEDAHCAISLLECVLKEVKRKHPQVQRAIILTDGAGCFSGTEFCGQLPQMGKWTGVQVKKHLISEVGAGKTFLDGHFAYIGKYLAKSVAEGKGGGDMEDASSAAKCLTADGGIAHSVALCATMQRPTGTLLHSFPDITTFHQREYLYDGEAVDADLFRCHMNCIAQYHDTPDLIVDADEIAGCFVDCVLPGPTRVEYCVGGGPAGAIPVASTASPSARPRTRPQQFALSKSEKVAKRVVEAEREVHKERIRVEKQRETESAAAKRRQHSTLYYCKQPGCVFSCRNAEAYRAHVSKDSPEDHDIARDKIKYNRLSEATHDRRGTDHDIILRACAASTQQVGSRVSLAVLEAHNHSEPPLVPLQDVQLGMLYDGTTPVDTTNLHLSRGYGIRHDAAITHLDAKTLQFILFAQGRGDKAVGNGTKSHPAQCVRAMEHKGTEEGVGIFVESALDLQTMLPNEDRHREFGIHQWLHMQQWKAQLGRPRADIEAQYKRTVARDENLAANAADPLRSSIYNIKARATMQRRYIKLCNNHPVEQLTDQQRELHLAIEADEFGKPLQTLRELIFKLVVAHGRVASDVIIFMT